MGERRMLTAKVTDADAFVSMPSSAQALYLHLNMGADDDGFNNQVQLAMFKAHASVDDVKLLLAKRFILQFESGVIVIKHWRMANALRNDRYKPTNYQEELSMLQIKDNKSYTFKDGAWLPNGCQTVAEVETDGSQTVALTQLNITKDNITKDKKSERKRFTPPTFEEVKAYCDERQNNVDANKFIDYYESNGWMVGRNKMKDWKAAVRTWERSGYNSEPKKNNVVIPMPDYMVKQKEEEQRRREGIEEPVDPEFAWLEKYK